MFGSVPSTRQWGFMRALFALATAVTPVVALGVWTSVPGIADNATFNLAELPPLPAVDSPEAFSPISKVEPSKLGLSNVEGSNVAGSKPHAGKTNAVDQLWFSVVSSTTLVVLPVASAGPSGSGQLEQGLHKPCVRTRELAVSARFGSGGCRYSLLSGSFQSSQYTPRFSASPVEHCRKNPAG